MSYAILRVRKLSTAGQMSGMQRHNDRTNNVRNADPDLRHMNRGLSKTKTGDIRQDVEARIEQAGVKVKSNSVKCLEFLMTASNDAFHFKKVKTEEGKWTLEGDTEKWYKFRDRSIEWLQDRYGAENLVNLSIHYDEKTPHIHAYVTPIIRKEKKWKNQKGSGVKIENSLTARDIVGGKEKLSAMQDDFALVMSDLGLKRGEKGSKAHHEDISKYYERVNKSKEFNKELEQFEVKSNTLEIPKPSVAFMTPGRRDEWFEDVQNRVNKAIESAQIDGAEQISNQFKDEFAKVVEFKKLDSQLRAEISRLTNLIDLERGNAIKEGIRVSEREKEVATLRAERSKLQRKINTWEKKAKEAVVDKDPNAIHDIVGYFRKLRKGQEPPR